MVFRPSPVEGAAFRPLVAEVGLLQQPQVVVEVESLQQQAVVAVFRPLVAGVELLQQPQAVEGLLL